MDVDVSRASLRDYTKPCVADRAVDEISTADVMEILLPIFPRSR